MTVIIWTLFAVLMALWTGFAALSTSLVGWLLSGLADGQVTGAAEALGQWPIPIWLGAWIDPVFISDLQHTWLSAVQWLSDVLPAASTLIGWVVPLMWTGWGLVSMCLLAAALLGHWLVGKFGR